MKKTVKLLSSALIAGSLLAGCGMNGNGNADQAGNGTPQNVNYQTNQTNPNPVRNINNYPNATSNNSGNQTNQTTMYSFNNQTAQTVAREVNQIPGVTYATTLINGNNVVVGITTTAGAKNQNAIKGQVRDVVQKYVGNKQVRVVSDRRMVNRMTTINDRVLNGAPGREVGSDVRGIFNDLGDIFQRPFQNNAR